MRYFSRIPLEESVDLWNNRTWAGLVGIVKQGVTKMHRKRAAFTLVELLVVITIIGMLVALLVPAVIAARERARQGVCVNRMRELATATIHYESVKGQLPGWRNQAPLDSDVSISWVVALFPYLDREDLWKEWRDGAGPEVVYEEVVCPSDMGNLTNPAPLNYVANRNLFRDRSSGANLSANTVTLDRLTSAQRTVLFAERVYRDTTKVGPWNDITTGTPIDRFTLDPPGGSVTFFSLRNNATGVSSNHSGILNIAFADGHVETVAEDTLTDVYQW